MCPFHRQSESNAYGRPGVLRSYINRRGRGTKGKGHRGGGLKFSVALAVLVGSATDVAITCTVRWVLIIAGGVYRPVSDTDPRSALSVQVTAVLAALETVAVNCCVLPGLSKAVIGLMVTLTTATSVPDLLSNAPMS